ncbi:type II toxin-antitoxin system HicA family toxin [Oleispirillum naphthae]|uniref:type II toxin-antitoxin system HicA family toxin n=1 Tax=Oleispirillum naphthae TaxID=2838853 RepID=UPI0030823FEA
MDSRDVIKALEAGGWLLKRITGSHHHYIHPEKPGLTTVPHPKRDMPQGTLRAIERQSGLKLTR